MEFLNNIKSKIIRNEIDKSLDKLDTSVLMPALENLLSSIGLVEREKQKDRTSVKQLISHKLMEIIRLLNGLA